MKLQSILTILTIFITTSCTLAPHYERPFAPIPASWPEGEAYKTPSGSIATDLTWKDFFPDKHLQKLIELALQNNRDLKLASMNVERARALYGVHRAELFPSVGGTTSVGIQRKAAELSSTGEPKIENTYSLNVGITSWELDFFGRIRSLEKAALEDYLATEEAQRSVQLSLISSVAQAYYTFIADREALSLARSTLKTQEEIYNLINRRFTVGLATEIDRRRAETQVESAKTEVARLVRQVAQDKNALQLLVGIPLPDALLPDGNLEVEPPGEISPGLPSEVLLRRPDVLTAEHRLKVAYANIGVARAALFPRISLTNTVGAASNELTGLFSGGSGTWVFGSGLTIPIFDARSWAALRVTKVDREIAIVQYEKAIQGAFREVADELALKGTVDEEVKSQEALVKALKETYKLTLMRYEKGIESYLSVLDAQRSLYAAEQKLISLRLSRNANRVRLYAVLGGGVKP
ncbi:MAG: efflux transporter outer membrane subunit [Syntrophobacterales bacterium]|nr:efflux transporter outer membrane subunit [Syntrophobacterales bacterium]